jgi:hypothetical protein
MQGKCRAELVRPVTKKLAQSKSDALSAKPTRVFPIHNHGSVLDFAILRYIGHVNG